MQSPELISDHAPDSADAYDHPRSLARRRAREALAQKSLELTALLRASRAIASSIDYEDVLRRIAQAAGEALGSPECVIWEYAAESGVDVFRCLWERDPVPGVADDLVGSSYDINLHTGGLDALRAGVVLQESRSDPGLSPITVGHMDEWGEKTWLTVPLVHGRNMLGVMILVETARERAFTADEIHMATTLGEQAAVALQNALRHRREEEKNRWLRCLVAASRAVTATPDPDAALAEVARIAAEAMQSPAAFVYEYARDRDELVARSRHAPANARPADTVGSTFPLRDLPPGDRPLDDGMVFVETRSDDDLPHHVRRAMEAEGERTRLNVPLRYRDDDLGLLVLVEYGRERVFNLEEREFMRAFGEQVTLALITARLATTDGLTGLANHRVFRDRLEHELARAQRYGSPVSLLILDIDDFKTVNDTHGHPAGDEVLRRFGRLVSDQLRRGVDLVARYGGEEFAVMLPGTGSSAQGVAADNGGGGRRPDADGPAAGHSEGAEVLAERLRSIVAHTPLVLGDAATTVRVTVSIGIASFPDMAGDMDDLVARADAALYAAKRAGKDRAEVYGRATVDERSGAEDTATT